jgi:dipeptidyl aminopeptidase/acylaminoacyl peptidase
MSLRFRFVLCTLAVAGPVAAAVSPDLLLREPCNNSDGDYAPYVERQLTTYRQEAAAAAKQGLTMRDESSARAGLLTKKEYAERHGRDAVVCERLTYRSDDLKVIGYLWRDARPAKKPQPIIVFHRGGVQQDSQLRPNTQFGFYRFVKAGYVVIGTQYRGNDGGEGRDELGGADVNDVLKIIEIAKTFDGVDATNIFALGYSRGAMEALLAAARGAPFRAVATVGLPADMLSSFKASPPRAAVYGKFIPNFDADPETALKARSALYWADQIQMPLLLIAGSADPLVAAHSNSIPMAARLGELKKTYELLIYEGDSHGVMINARDRDSRVIAWFQRFGASGAKNH